MVDKDATVTAHSESSFSSVEYNSVAVSSSLDAINLLSSKFHIAAEHLGDVSEWKLNYGRDILSCEYNDEGKYVAAIIRYTVTGKVGRKRAMQCQSEFGVFYSINTEAKEAAVLAFCKTVGSFAAYPYFRALVSQLCWNAGINLPPLPAIASTAHIPKRQKAVEE